jgi:hypothetical protein
MSIDVFSSPRVTETGKNMKHKNFRFYAVAVYPPPYGGIMLLESVNFTLFA